MNCVHHLLLRRISHQTCRGRTVNLDVFDVSVEAKQVEALFVRDLRRKVLDANGIGQMDI